MRLTDEERAIADRVAERMAEENEADDAWGHAMLYIAARREAFGEADEPGAATAAGVGDDVKAVSDEVVAWMVASPTGYDSAVFHVREDAVRFARGVHGVVPLVRQGSPRGVVVTAAQRKAVAVAASVYRVSGWKDRVTGWQEVADELDGLLAAIDAAKGGGA